MIDRARLFISGAVTGVNYRVWMVDNAEELGLTGWVKNVSEKTVEAVIEGEKGKINELIERCHNGPDAAWVENLEVKWEDPEEEFDDFRIRY